MKREIINSTVSFAFNLHRPFMNSSTWLDRSVSMFFVIEKLFKFDNSLCDKVSTSERGKYRVKPYKTAVIYFVLVMAGKREKDQISRTLRARWFIVSQMIEGGELIRAR